MTEEDRKAHRAALARRVRIRLEGPLHTERDGRRPDLGSAHTTISRELLEEIAEALEKEASR